ncbi:MAG: DUF2079 domain-containing protein [Deltaproteobacteria bacterium]|nr:DUF2079 domain-containing protein [Deltaproteobacteria bacterium]
MLWNSVHGRVGLSGFLWRDRSLAAGFAPLLLVLAGPYAILERAETLLVIQSLAVAACAFPLARLARRELTNPSLAHALVLAQAAYLPMRVAARCDFQPALLAAPLLLECFVSFREGRIRRGAWAWGGALACGPLVVPAACSLGIYVALVLRRGRLGVMLVCLSLGWLAALTLLAGSAEPSNPWFVGLAPSAPMIILVALAPLAFLPLLAPTHAMLALPSVVLAAMYASTGRGGTDGGHLAVAAPMLLVAATFGARKLIERDDLRTLLAFYPTVAELERYVAGLLLLGAVVFIGWSPVAELRLASGRASIDRRQVLAGVPEDALVSAQANLAAHLARRAHVAVFPDRLAPWIVLDGGRWSGFGASAGRLVSVGRHGYESPPAVWWTPREGRWCGSTVALRPCRRSRPSTAAAERW